MANKKQARGFSTGKIIIIVVLFFGTGLLVAYALNSRTDSAKSQDQQPGGAVIQKPVLGVPVPVMEFPSEVKAYVRDVLAAPIPADYKLPESILSQTNYDMAVGQVGKNYPEFNGLEGEQLLLAVKANPLRYQELIREARATREHFHPGTQPRIPPTEAQ